MRFYWLLLLAPSAAFAKTENWPRLYNNGVTAYESNDFARAAASFENATASADRALQQRALYNLGNASYRLGEAQPAQAQQLWQRALKNYETALAIDPKDADAQFNHDFVKKKLEELKIQQEEQQQQQDKKQDQKQDDQQQQQPQDGQQQNPQDKGSDQQQSKQSESKEQQKQEEQQKDEQQKQQAQQEKQPQPKQPTQEKDVQPQSYEKMQAAALLDNLREDERNWNFFPEVQMKDLKDSGEPTKDW